MHLSKFQLAIIALIITNIIWGSAAPIFKWSLENIEPFTLAFLRFFIAALILLPFVLNKLTIQKKDYFTLILLSILGITLNISFFFIGLKFSSSINAPVIASSGPIFLILGSLLFLKEKLKAKVLTGTLISLIGVLIIILRPVLENGIDGKVFGNILFVIATLGSVGHTILLKRIASKYDPLTLTYYSFLIGAVTFFPMFYIEAQTHGFLTNLNIQGITGIIFGAFLSSALAYSLYAFALKYMVANEVGVFVYLDPIVAILIAIPLLHETVTFSFLLGSILVFLGIFIAEGRLHYHPIHKLKESHT